MDTENTQHSQASRKNRLATEEPLLQSVEAEMESERQEEETMKFNTHVIIGVYIFVIAMGVLTGYVLSKSSVVSQVTSTTKNTGVGTDKSVGSSDSTTFKDTATGVIEKGGLNGEGTHKLIREGGPSQTAYLTSSIVDLDEYIGKKVTIWGQTMTAKKVSWLMDVGKLEPLTE